MKNLITIIMLVAGVSILMAFKPLKEEIYKVDIERSSIEWTAKKVGGGHVGTIKIVEGNLAYNGKSLNRGSFTMNMSSITSDNERVTVHLNSAFYKMYVLVLLPLI